MRKRQEKEVKKADVENKKLLFLGKKEEIYKKLQRRMNEENLRNNSFSLFTKTKMNIEENKKYFSGQDTYVPHKLMSIIEKSQTISSLIPTASSVFSSKFEENDLEICSTQLKYTEAVNDDLVDYEVDHFNVMMNELSPYILAEQRTLKSFNSSLNSSTDLIYEAVCDELGKQYIDIPDLHENNKFEELLIYRKREMEAIYLTTACLVEVDFDIEGKTKAVFEDLIDLEGEENGGKLERKRAFVMSLFNIFSLYSSFYFSSSSTLNSSSLCSDVMAAFSQQKCSLFSIFYFFDKISYNPSFLSLPSTRTNQLSEKNNKFKRITPSEKFEVRNVVDIIITSLIEELKESIYKKEFIFII
jgi:hypothetical protein